MHVLHAIWGNNSKNENKLYIWAESSAPFSADPKARKSKLHPFAASKNDLKELIGSFSTNFICESAEIEKRTFTLPSSKKRPVPSPWLILDEEHINATELASWDITTLTLYPYLAFDFLLRLPRKSHGRIVFGDSLRFLAEMAKFSLELLTQQKFAPSIKEVKQKGSVDFKAVWKTIIEEDDIQRINLLSDAMPPYCRSLQNEKRTSLEIVTSFVNEVTDTFIKKSLSHASLISRRSKSLARQWITALSTDKPVFLKASNKELASFSSELEAWFVQLKPSSREATFRTCLRVDPPTIESGYDEDWWIRFFLQAKDDRSLLVSAEDVWKTKSSTLTFLKHRFENPQERLLEDLGRASQIFHGIEESLQIARPVGLRLNTKDAYSFIREQAPLLEQSGFGVLLPSWWKKPSAQVGVKLKLKSPEGGVKSGLFGMDGIVAYDWEVAIGDEVVSLEEFQKLANLKVPLVKIRGEWVELRQDDIEKAIEFFKKKRDSEMTLGEALRFGLGAEDAEIGLPVVGIDAEGGLKNTLGNLIKGKNLKIKMIKQPQTFKGELRPYQAKGISWLSFLKKLGFGACLADDMGLGKTIELIALLLHDREKKKKLRPTLLICPMSVVGNWQKEIKRFSPSLKVLVHHGTERLAGKNFAKDAEKNDIVVSTYALAHRDEEETLSKVHWESIVLDEAQNIKNPNAKQTRSIKKLKSSYKIALTGTPVENRLSELWSIMDFLNPGYLKSVKRFHSDFALPIEMYHNKKRAEVLRRMIQPFVLRRMKTDPKIIKDLPEKMEMKVYCNLTVEQASLYEAVVKDMIIKIEESEGIDRKGLILATLMKLKQICNHPAQFAQDGSPLPNRSGKLTRIEEMLEEVLAEGDKALIFTQFAGMGVMLRHHLQEKLGHEILFLHGGTARKKRDAMIQRFQDDVHGHPIFILSLKAGGIGLNLTAANHVFHFDRWWNPAVEDQATDRVFRIGQKKNVEVHKFVCIGTLEERIDEMIERKKKLADAIIGSGESWLTELSTDQLRELFTLGSDAVRGE